MHRLVLLALLMVVSPGAAVAMADQEAGERCVILLHGLFRSSLAMKPLQWYLEREGYVTVNHSYPSLLYPIPELAQTAVTAGLQSCHSMGAHRINFVTHSLGGILVRHYAGRQAIQGLERVVMLGPPNRGSQVADFYSSFEWLEPIEPEAIIQLGTGSESVPLSLGPVDFELGVIAGALRDHTLLPGFPDEPSDGTVSVAEAVVPGMLDFIQLPVTHTFMIWNPTVMRQVAHFLEYGKFARPE